MISLAKWTIISALFATTLMNSGCASYLSYKYSKEEIYQKRIYASGNREAVNMIKNGANPEYAIRAVPMGDQGAGIAIDLASLDVLMEHPFRQLGAALLDVAIVYGTYRGVDSLNNNSHEDKIPATAQSGSGGGPTITVDNGTGSGNTTTISVINGNDNGGNQNPNDGQNTTGNSGGTSGSASPSTSTETSTTTTTTADPTDPTP